MIVNTQTVSSSSDEKNIFDFLFTGGFVLFGVKVPMWVIWGLLIWVVFFRKFKIKRK